MSETLKSLKIEPEVLGRIIRGFKAHGWAGGAPKQKLEDGSEVITLNGLLASVLEKLDYVCLPEINVAEMRSFGYTDHWQDFGGWILGREVVTKTIDKNSTPIWEMHYAGGFTPNFEEQIAKVKPGELEYIRPKISRVLRQALGMSPENAPYRGPKKCNIDGYDYSNTFVGDLSDFRGLEQVVHPLETVAPRKRALFPPKMQTNPIIVWNLVYQGRLLVPKG